MAKLSWSRDLETGINIIDEQHMRIVEYINILEDTKNALDRDKVAEVIDELVHYTVSHFSFEESLLEKAEYGFTDPHKKVHALFINKVNEFSERFKAGENVADELNSMLQRWLVGHIKKEDQDYVATVKRQLPDLDEGSGGWLSKSLKRFFG
jgi:hemerythrin